MVKKYDGILRSKVSQSTTHHFQRVGLLTDKVRDGKYVTEGGSQQMCC